MPDSSQKTSNLYTADSLQPRDTQLLWAREFSTQVSTDRGDLFETGGDVSGDVIGIEGRLGALAIVGVASPVPTTNPRGTTFLIPPWESYPTSPFAIALGFPSVKFITIYAKLRFYSEVSNPAANPLGMLVMAGEDLVGSVPAEPFSGLVVAPRAQIAPRQQPLVGQVLWENGGGFAPTGQFDEFPDWGATVYIRLTIAANADDPDKGSDGDYEFSHDGIAWQRSEDGISRPDHFRRFGIGLTSEGSVGIEFLRIYSYLPVVESLSTTSLIPGPTPTGSRLFVS